MAINPIDVVEETCAQVVDKTVAQSDKGKFNIVDVVPFPLHITLARFSPNTTDRQRADAEEWVSKYRRKIWGKLSDCSLVITGAKTFPFGDIYTEKIR